MGTEEDPLEGFRARTDQDEVNEQIVDNIRGMADNGVDYVSMSVIMLSNELKAALKEDKLLRRLVAEVTGTLKECSHAWSESDDPDKTKELHLKARACKLVLNWIEGILQAGEVAEQLIAQEDNEDG